MKASTREVGKHLLECVVMGIAVGAGLGVCLFVISYALPWLVMKQRVLFIVVFPVIGEILGLALGCKRHESFGREREGTGRHHGLLPWIRHAGYARAFQEG